MKTAWPGDKQVTKNDMARQARRVLSTHLAPTIGALAAFGKERRISAL